jgi:hypothetical protein
MGSISIADLEKQIALYFDTYSAKRVALATLVVALYRLGYLLEFTRLV